MMMKVWGRIDCGQLQLCVYARAKALDLAEQRDKSGRHGEPLNTSMDVASETKCGVVWDKGEVKRTVCPASMCTETRTENKNKTRTYKIIITGRSKELPRCSVARSGTDLTDGMLLLLVVTAKR